MISCSIVIAAYNVDKYLAECLKSIFEMDYPTENYEVIVVDNNSTDGTQAIIQQFPNVIFLHEEKKGAANARNKGILQAKNNILVFLDADAYVSPQWLTNLLAPFSEKMIGAVCGEIAPIRSGNIISEYIAVSFLMRCHRYGKKRDIKGAPSGNLAIRKDALSGLFEPELLHGEDKDLTYRIIKNGFRVVFQPGAVIFHDHPDSFKKLTKVFIAGALGRVLLSKRYKLSPDILFFKYHVPLVFICLLAGLLLSGNLFASSLLIAPLLSIMLISILRICLVSKKIFLCIIIKPLFDIYSIIITYVSFQFFTIKALLKPERKPHEN